jgi:hypothetical protein
VAEMAVLGWVPLDTAPAGYIYTSAQHLPSSSRCCKDRDECSMSLPRINGGWPPLNATVDPSRHPARYHDDLLAWPHSLTHGRL